VPRHVIYGAGAIGGTIGSRLVEHGHEVVLIARGAHREAIAERGLRFVSPDGARVQRIDVVGGPEELEWCADDVVLLSMKGQDTAPALERLEAVAEPTIAVVCAQNGVENERAALRRFADVYSVVVQLPASHLEAGVVVAYSSPVTGSLDIGRHPGGLDERAREIAAVFRDSGFAAEPRADITRWKYAKFLRNVANAVDALFERPTGAPEVERRARAEAVAVLEAAGIDYVGAAEYDERHERLITIKPVGGHPRGGGSSWQSLVRGVGGIESDQLNGEVVLLGRLHGVPTPVNELLRRLAGAAARTGAPPGGHREAEFLAALAEG
jgi:2-dehydropantoate 2-reductase